MKQLKSVIFLLGVLICLSACSRKNEALFNAIYTLTEQNNFFKAKELYESNKDAFSVSYQQFTEAVLSNAFNKVEESEKQINCLINKKGNIPDSLQFKLYEIRYDNAVKLYSGSCNRTIISNIR